MVALGHLDGLPTACSFIRVIKAKLFQNFTHKEQINRVIIHNKNISGRINQDF
ncbi:MAG: hypothetical protein R3D66_06525 [Alphaproteobacteria bacterium]